MAADYDNVRAAMNFALDHAPTVALRMIGRLTFFLGLRGGFTEAKAWLDMVLPRTAGEPQELVGRAHECAAGIAYYVADIEGAARHADEAYAVFARIGDEHGMANALRERGKAAGAGGDSARAAAIFTELAELAERIGDRWNGAIALNNLGDVALQAGDWEQVVELCGRSSILRRDLGDEWGMALALTNVAVAELQLGRLSSAGSSLRVALETSMKVDATIVVSWCLDLSASIALALGNVREAARLVGRPSDCTKSSARPGAKTSKSVSSSEASSPSACRSEWMFRPTRSSADASCRSRRRWHTRWRRPPATWTDRDGPARRPARVAVGLTAALRA